MKSVKIIDLVTYILENDKNNLFKMNDYTINLEDTKSLFNADGVFGKVVEIDNEGYVTLQFEDTLGYSDKMHYSIFCLGIYNVIYDALCEIKVKVDEENKKTYAYALCGILDDEEYETKYFSTYEKAKTAMVEHIHHLRNTTWVGDFITQCLSLCFDTKKYPNWEFADTDYSFHFYADKTALWSGGVVEVWIEKIEIK